MTTSILTDAERQRIDSNIIPFERKHLRVAGNDDGAQCVTEPIESAHLFEQVRSTVTRFVRLGEHEATAIALWTMMTHAQDAFDYAAYLSVTSAEKQSGKTRLLEVLKLIVAKPLMTSHITPAALVRTMHSEHPTLLFDEVDATFKGDKEFAQTLRGVLNSGYERGGSYTVTESHGKQFVVTSFSTFGAKILAGIGALPDTIADRSIPIRLTRKLTGEKVERFRRRLVQPEMENLRAQLEQWAQAFVAEGEHPAPVGLDTLSDRSADITEPLLMIAETCGAVIAAEAREAIVSLCGHKREDASLGVTLLSDIKLFFDKSRKDRCPSAELAEALAGREESPWGPRFGRPFDARVLAKLLRGYDDGHGGKIGPKGIRLADGSTPKGYHRDQFGDAWARFLPSPPAITRAGQQPQHDVQPQRGNPHEIRDVADVADVAVPGDGGKGRLPEPCISLTPSALDLRNDMLGGPVGQLFIGDKVAAIDNNLLDISI